MHEVIALPPIWWPTKWHWENYILAWADRFNLYFLNSTMLTAAIVTGSVFTSSLGGFIFAKYDFRGKEFLFTTILGTMMIPFVVWMVPAFQMVIWFRWLDSYYALIVPSLVSAFGIFLMKQFIEGIPDELILAARVDGCADFAIYTARCAWPRRTIHRRCSCTGRTTPMCRARSRSAWRRRSPAMAWITACSLSRAPIIVLITRDCRYQEWSRFSRRWRAFWRNTFEPGFRM